MGLIKPNKPTGRRPDVIPKTNLQIRPPRRRYEGNAETLLVFVEKLSGRTLGTWEADVILALVEAVRIC